MNDDIKHVNDNDNDNNRLSIVSSLPKSDKKENKVEKRRQKMTRTERWDEMYERLLIWRKKHGHCIVPNRYSGDRQLGTWVSTQRRHYKALLLGRNTSLSMTPERAQKLAEIGFDWSAKNKSADIKWESQFTNLLEYVIEHGHPLVPIGWAETMQLANWISTQLQEYKAHRRGMHSSLTKNRSKLLSSIGFIWEAPLSGLGELRKLLQNNNNSNEFDDGSSSRSPLNSVQLIAIRLLHERKKPTSSISFSKQEDICPKVLFSSKQKQQQQRDRRSQTNFLSNHKKIDTTDAIVETLLCKNNIQMEAEALSKKKSPSEIELLQLPTSIALTPNITSPYLNLNSLAAVGLGGSCHNNNINFPRLSVQYQPVLVASTPGGMMTTSSLFQQQQQLHQPAPSLLFSQQRQLQQQCSLMNKYGIPTFSQQQQQQNVIQYQNNQLQQQYQQQINDAADPILSSGKKTSRQRG